MSATQGNIREYETIFILRPDSTDQIQDSVRSRIESVMEKLEGRLLKFDNWGKRKLAFDIRDRTGQKKHYKGLYQYIRYAGGNELVPELERNLRMQEPVLRYLTIKIDDDSNVEELEARIAAETQVAATPEATEAADAPAPQTTESS
jgi:small subunit ribosomal protein S6